MTNIANAESELNKIKRILMLNFMNCFLYFQNAHGTQVGHDSFYLRNQLFTHIGRGISAIQVVVYTLTGIRI